LSKTSVRTWPVQQIEIEVIGAETGEARLTSVRHAISGYITGSREPMRPGRWTAELSRQMPKAL
jgi:hypothetical protein